MKRNYETLLKYCFYRSNYPLAGNPCPGNRPYTPCNRNPCDELGECASNPDLTCQVSECSSCKAVWYDDNDIEQECQGRFIVVTMVME